MKTWLARSLMLAASALALGLIAACDDDGDDATPVPEETASAEARQELADTISRIAAIDGAAGNQDDIDYYLAHVTDNFVQLFGSDSVEACGEVPEVCIGQPLTNPSVDVSTVSIDGDEGVLVLNSDEGGFEVHTIKEGDDWKADRLSATSDEIAEGVETVDLVLDDFSFDMDEDEPLSEDFAFHITNEGDQIHEVVVVKLPAEGDLSELLASEDPESSGVEFIAFKFPFGPGDEADMALPPLEAGRYALLCFLPDTEDPEGTPHAEKGMTAEFRVE